VIRHSEARVCTIAVRVDPATATLDISDDGVGSRPGINAGTGLLGLRERFAAAGGSVDTTSRAGGGFRLVATVPVPAATRDVVDNATAEELVA
jgi:two-component system sensor histidine kinase DesK